MLVAQLIEVSASAIAGSIVCLALASCIGAVIRGHVEVSEGGVAVVSIRARRWEWSEIDDVILTSLDATWFTPQLILTSGTTIPLWPAGSPREHDRSVAVQTVRAIRTGLETRKRVT